MNEHPYVAVFCSASEVDRKYAEQARNLAGLMLNNGYNLVWGASERGLMKVMADTMKAGGARLVGVTVDFLKDAARRDADELIVARSLGERKETMLARSSAVVVLPGGVGTLDEITEIVELKKHGRHLKPVVVLNTCGFYTGLITQLNRMRAEGFIPKPVEDLVFFADTPESAMEYINSHMSPS